MTHETVESSLQTSLILVVFAVQACYRVVTVVDIRIGKSKTDHTRCIIHNKVGMEEMMLHVTISGARTYHLFKKYLPTSACIMSCSIVRFHFHLNLSKLNNYNEHFAGCEFRAD